MKRYILGVLLFSGLVSVLIAQETYTVPVGAAGVAKLDRERVRSNNHKCSRFVGLPIPCTQAQICTAASAPGLAACTAAQAASVDVELFPATQAGREGFLIRKVIVEAVTAWSDSNISEDRDAFCAIYKASPGPTCTAVGLPATCELCR